MLSPTFPRLPALRTDSSSQPLVIQLTALYEDLEAGLRAKALLEGVKSTVMAAMPVQFRLELWRFDWLRESSMSSMALSSARGSSLLIVCATSDKSPPKELDRWVEAWAKDGEEQLCALVLFANPDICSEAHPLHDCLQRAAERKGVEFLCEGFQTAREEQTSVSTWLHSREEVFPA